MDAFSDFIDRGFGLLRQTVANFPLLGSAATPLLFSRFELSPAETCQSLSSEADLSSLNATILESNYFHNVSQLVVKGAFQPIADIGPSVCRVHFVVNTSSISSVKAEAWLPTNWNQRFLAIGNGGLGGCES